MHKRLFGAAAGVAMSWGLSDGRALAAADAAPAGAEASEITEVVVTARKRTETLQDVPLSVAVASGQRLQEQSLTSVESLQTITSGLVIRKSPNNIATVSLRGLGTGTGNGSFEQSVATFLDGAYIGRGPEFNLALFDFERAEVIKGTQASLLAKNTSLGAISLITRKPGDSFGYDVVGSYEFELNSYLAEGGVDLPISDQLKVRVSGQLSRQGGWVDNALTGHDDPRTTSRAGRIVARWTPTDAFDATLLFQTYRYHQLGQNTEFVADALGAARRYALAGGYSDFETALDRHTGQSDPAFGSSRDLTTGDRAILTLNYQLGDYTLTSVSSYSTYDQDRKFDTDFLPGALLVQDPLHEGNEQHTQEVRVTSAAGKRFDFVAGAFYLREDWDFSRTLVARAPLALTGSLAEAFAQDTEAWSAFGQGNLRITERLTASAGVRYTDETRGAGLIRVQIVPGLASSFVYPPYPLSHLRRSEDNIDGSVGVQFRASEDALLYASWSKGSKSGGFINSPTRPSTAAYDAEVARTVEAGGKFSFDRGHLNIGLFNTNLDGFQQAVFNGTGFIIISRDVRSRGVEADAAWRLAPGLRLSGSVTRADTQRLDNDTQPMGAPKWSGNVNLNFMRGLGDDFELVGDVGVEFRSRILLTDAEQTRGHPKAPASAVVPTSPAYGKLNARLALRWPDRGWEVGIVGRNLLDEKMIGYGIPAPFITGAAIGSSEAPRTIAVQFIARR